MSASFRPSVVLALAFLSTAATGARGEAGVPQYREMRENRFSVEAIKVPSEGVEIRKDVATFRLESGEIRPMEPMQGRVTGFVFNGMGRFRMTVPDAFEVAQLRRFSQKDELTGIDTTISALVLRTVEALPAPIAATFPGADAYARNTLAYDRAQLWLKDWSFDVDARIVAGLRMPGDGFLVADVKTDDFGWLHFEFEPWDGEEITLAKELSTDGMIDVWVGLDQESERDVVGRPTSDPRAIVDVESIDVEADLANHRGELLLAGGTPNPDPIRFRTRVAMVVRRDGISALPFDLSERAEVKAVRGPGGAALPYLREEVGKHFALVADERSVGSLVVLVDAPLQAGARFELEFDYDLKTLNYVSGRHWYPMPPDSLNDLHTARLTAKGRDRIEVRAAGKLESEKVADGVRTSVWVSQNPAIMFGFSFGVGFREEKIKIEGAPEAIAFGVPTGAVWGNMVRNVAVDVARSAKFYQEYFGIPMHCDELWATAITGWHGQAFDGLIHMAQGSFNEEHPGSSELFRAHEVAHEYWGHLVGWKTYRDQWLSEGFAQYSAMMFVESVLPKDKYFDEIVETYNGDQLGSLKAATYKYSRANGVLQKTTARRELGPIAAGYRASTARLPIGYQLQAYEKGALVLHTLRTVLSSMNRQDDLFRRLMQDFLRENLGRAASTADFQALLERKIPFAWGPFFQAYVYRTAIPAFTWSWSVDFKDGKYDLVVSIDATDVPEGFQLPIPLAVEFGGGRLRYTFVPMEGASKTFHIPVPTRPVNVVLNPNNGVLAAVKRKK